MLKQEWYLFIKFTYIDKDRPNLEIYVFLFMTQIK